MTHLKPASSAMNLRSGTASRTGVKAMSTVKLRPNWQGCRAWEEEDQSGGGPGQGEAGAAFRQLRFSKEKVQLWYTAISASPRCSRLRGKCLDCCGPKQKLQWTKLHSVLVGAPTTEAHRASSSRAGSFTTAVSDNSYNSGVRCLPNGASRRMDREPRLLCG